MQQKLTTEETRARESWSIHGDEISRDTFILLIFQKEIDTKTVFQIKDSHVERGQCIIAHASLEELPRRAAASTVPSLTGLFLSAETRLRGTVALYRKFCRVYRGRTGRARRIDWRRQGPRQLRLKTHLITPRRLTDSPSSADSSGRFSRAVLRIRVNSGKFIDRANTTRAC